MPIESTTPSRVLLTVLTKPHEPPSKFAFERVQTGLFVEPLPYL